GAYGLVIAVIYFAPAAILFSLASMALFRGWNHQKGLHWLSWLWLASPVAWAPVATLIGAIAA
ncbi:hypothetical protein, partial [Lysobacter sp. P5_B9]